MGQLQGKIAIVTGAARGTGAATAKAFVAEGARVVIGDVLDALGTEVAAALGDAADFIHLDVTREADWAAAVDLFTEGKWADAHEMLTQLFSEDPAAQCLVRPLPSHECLNQGAYLKASNAEAADFFGSRLALSADGNTLAVGTTVESSRATRLRGGPK